MLYLGIILSEIVIFGNVAFSFFFFASCQLSFFVNKCILCVTTIRVNQLEFS